ncbi:MAG: PIG-L family deacetylase [Acidobacteriaceae bacterium]
MRAQYNEPAAESLPAALQPLLGRTLVVVAHPDDETIVCGGLMQFMRGPCVAFATDGAPEAEFWWRKYGSREAYARLRQHEAVSALAAVGVKQALFLREYEASPHEFADQQLYRVLPRAFEELLEFSQRFHPDALLTMAYEGGHPDHDCAAFLAARLGARLQVPVFESPLYHRSNDMPHFQEWTCDSGHSVELEIKDEVLARKKAMLAQYRSQFTTLSGGFRPELERFRVQAKYDFAQPPHPGKLNYEAWEWPITPQDLCRAFQQFDSAAPSNQHTNQ